MLKPAAVVAVVAAIALAATPLHAQDLVALCKQMAHPPVGSWASFKMVGGTDDGGTMKISVVGAESGDIWVELSLNGFGGAKGQKMSAMSKALVDGFGPEMAHPKQAILKLGSAPAMTMPVNG
ncbi:MAG TPA: hypothetical protein VH163_05530, partial [Gemmatimonadales bacterium]|nr:hypothetical protein [Gemmatimonadales bacterium]